MGPVVASNLIFLRTAQAGTAIKMLVQIGFLIYLGSGDESKAIAVVLPLLLFATGLMYVVRIPDEIKLEKAYMQKEEARLDWTNSCLQSRELLLRYRSVEQVSGKFQLMHSQEMWARFQFLLFSFNTGFLGKLVPVAAYATLMYVGGKSALDPESTFKLGDVVLVLSTLNSFKSSVKLPFHRLLLLVSVLVL
eukprot:SAG31_NODE_12542_length_934_cov_0.761677_2_plen_191_part_01